MTRIATYSDEYQYSLIPISHNCSQGLLERLDAGEVVIGDGGFVFALEKRGYVKAGPWTPEAAVEHPEAGMHIVYLSIFFTEPTIYCLTKTIVTNLLLIYFFAMGYTIVPTAFSLCTALLKSLMCAILCG